MSTARLMRYRGAMTSGPWRRVLFTVTVCALLAGAACSSFSGGDSGGGEADASAGEGGMPGSLTLSNVTKIAPAAQAASVAAAAKAA